MLKFVAMRSILKSTKDMISKRVRVLGRSFSSHRARRMLKKSFACQFRLGDSVLCDTRSKIKTFTTAKLLLSDQWSLKGLFRSFGTTRSQALPTHIDYCYKNNRHGPKHRWKIFSVTCWSAFCWSASLQSETKLHQIARGQFDEWQLEEHSETVTLHSSDISSHNLIEL